MTLGDDIRRLGADTRTALAALLDYHYQSIFVWGQVVDDVAGGRLFTAQDEISGKKANQTEIASQVNRYIDDYLTPATFQQLISIFEAFFFDMLALWLAAHPGSLYRKQVDLETILAAADKAAILQAVVDRELNDVKYRHVADWFDFLRKLVSVPGPSEDEAACLAEAKAGRDILIHNKGVVNAVYIAKSGTKARYIPGDILELPDPYFRGVTDLIEKIVADISTSVADRA